MSERINFEVATIKVRNMGERAWLFDLIDRKKGTGQPGFEILDDTRKVKGCSEFVACFGKLYDIDNMDPLELAQAIRISDYCGDKFVSAANLFRAILEIDHNRIEGQFWVPPGENMSFRCNSNEAFNGIDYVLSTESIRADGMQLLRDWFPRAEESLKEYAIGKLKNSEITILTPQGFKYQYEMSLYSPTIIKFDSTKRSGTDVISTITTLFSDPIMLNIRHDQDDKMYFTL